MSEIKAENKASPLLVYIIIFVAGFFAISKGGSWYANHKMMNDSMEKIAFMEKNNTDNYTLCSAISSAIDVANVTKSQKELDILKVKQRQLYCE